MQGNVKIILNLPWFIQAFPSALIFYTAKHQELNIKCNTTEEHSKAQRNSGIFKIPFIPCFHSWFSLVTGLCWKYPSVFADPLKCCPINTKLSGLNPPVTHFHEATVISCNKCLY